MVYALAEIPEHRELQLHHQQVSAHLDEVSCMLLHFLSEELHVALPDGTHDIDEHHQIVLLQQVLRGQHAETQLAGHEVEEDFPPIRFGLRRAVGEGPTQLLVGLLQVMVEDAVLAPVEEKKSRRWPLADLWD